jgi:hypothetical protein
MDLRIGNILGRRMDLFPEPWLQANIDRNRRRAF